MAPSFSDSLRQNSCASVQDTDVTGRSSPCCGLRFGGIRASHCRCVTSVAAMRKARVSVTRRGASSSWRSGSPAGLPIAEGPGRHPHHPHPERVDDGVGRRPAARRLAPVRARATASTSAIATTAARERRVRVTAAVSSGAR